MGESGLQGEKRVVQWLWAGEYREGGQAKGQPRDVELKNAGQCTEAGLAEVPHSLEI